MLELIGKIAIWMGFGLLVCVTVFPLLPTDRWWIRGWDFPRAHIGLAGVALGALALAFLPAGGRWVAVICAACALYQLARVLPYTPLWPQEIALGGDPGHRDAIHLLASNVLLENQTPERVTRYIRDKDPDLLLLMETDRAWDERLAPVLDRYPHVHRVVDNAHYGMIFATRLKLEQFRFVYLSDDSTPTALALLSDAQGAQFAFIGLHPRPPIPGENTRERDEQIRRSAVLARDFDVPVISMGDFNDVAWSDTSRSFKRHGAYLDPRIGRGFFASFDAHSWLMRFPIDQFYVTRGIRILQFERGPYVGSDHFPMHAWVSLEK